VQHRAGALAVEHVPQGPGGRAGAEVEHVGAHLRERHRPLDEPAAVAGEQAGGVALAQPARPQLARQPVGADVDLAPGQRAVVVDDREPARGGGRAGGVAGRGRDAVAGERQPHA
jgi:hypothetical protein